MNYKIITDESALKKFITFLPELRDYETYYVCLFARSKYCKEIVHIASDKQQLKRFTSTKQFLFDKIKQLECEYGSYKQRETTIPQEALATYISLNPRNMQLAAKNSLKRIADLYFTPSGWNLHQEIMSEIQKSSTKRPYFIVDIDDIDDIESVKSIIDQNNFINSDAVSYVKTRSGVHMLIKYDKIDKRFEKTWYNNIMNNFTIDQSGDLMIPIPGTYQGGFTPKLII